MKCWRDLIKLVRAMKRAGLWKSTRRRVWEGKATYVQP